jgi:hypothetical protein
MSQTYTNPTARGQKGTTRQCFGTLKAALVDTRAGGSSGVTTILLVSVPTNY